jgi:hypothetical protein
MKSKPSFWQKIGMHEWFLKKEEEPSVAVSSITPNDVYKYIIDKFQESIHQLSFAVLFSIMNISLLSIPKTIKTLLTISGESLV